MELLGNFATTVSTHDYQHVVDVIGELDAGTAATLSQTIAAIQRDGATQVVVDLRGVTFVDSRGLTALLESRQQLAEHAMTMTVRNLQPPVARLFRIAGVDAVLLDGDGGRGGELTATRPVVRRHVVGRPADHRP
jgi:anti-anti-sigma factor